MELLGLSQLADAIQHALEAYPRECCGYIRRSGTTRCRNVQNDLRAIDHKAYPRTTRNGFAFSANEQMAIYESVNGDDPVLAVYHSHPDGTLEFSRADRAGALLAGRPILGKVQHVVIACRAGRACGFASYRWTGQHFSRSSTFEVKVPISRENVPAPSLAGPETLLPMPSL